MQQSHHDVIYIDPKGDKALAKQAEEILLFYTTGRNAYGEWMKKLSITDNPPRGRCGSYFKEMAQDRTRLAGTAKKFKNKHTFPNSLDFSYANK